MVSDPVVQFVASKAREAGFVRKAYLFGSRARGDATLTSDYDFAFELIDGAESDWGAFCLTLEEDNPRLNTLDLIRLDQVGDDLRQRILQEGRVIYSKDSA